MKRILLFFSLLYCVNAQSNVIVQPDTITSFTFRTASSFKLVDNRSGACLSWTFSYYSYGFSALSVIVQNAPDSNGTPGSFSTFTAATGSNPSTVTTFTQSTYTNYAPWVKVTLSSVTGTGALVGSLYCYKNSASRVGGGGGGGTPGGSTNDVQFNNAGSFGGGRCTMDSSQNVVCGGSYTAGSGSGTTGSLQLTGATSSATSTLTVDATNTATTLKFPNDATSGLRIATSPTASPTSGCAQFNGTGTQLTSTGVACGSGGGSSGGFTTYSSAAVTLPAAGTTFFPPGGGGLPSGTEANVQGASPAATISSFYVQLSANIGVGNTIALTFRKAGADQTVTCTISGAASACNDTTHTFTVTAGDLLSIKGVTTGTVVIAPEIIIMFSTGSGGGSGGGVTVHHQFFTGAIHNSTCAGGSSFNSAVNGASATNLCGSNPVGVTGPFALSAQGIVYVFIPPTWDGSAMTFTLETVTTTNNTGNFSFTPSFLCQASGADMQVAGTYTSGSTVTHAAPGGSGGGVYRVSFALTITPTCTAGDGLQLKFTRGGSDTYSDNVFMMGADLAMTY